MAINRIRHYYKQIAGNQAALFLLSGHDDGHGVFGNAAVPAEGRSQLFTFASVVALIDSVVGGSTIAFAVSALPGTPLGVAAGSGIAVGLVSTVLLLRHGERLLAARAGATEAIFPTPER